MEAEQGEEETKEQKPTDEDVAVDLADVSTDDPGDDRDLPSPSVYELLKINGVPQEFIDFLQDDVAFDMHKIIPYYSILPHHIAAHFPLPGSASEWKDKMDVDLCFPHDGSPLVVMLCVRAAAFDGAGKRPNIEQMRITSAHAMLTLLMRSSKLKRQIGLVTLARLRWLLPVMPGSFSVPVATHLQDHFKISSNLFLLHILMGLARKDGFNAFVTIKKTQRTTLSDSIDRLSVISLDSDICERDVVEQAGHLYSFQLPSRSAFQALL
jgi:hypothetical protein